MKTSGNYFNQIHETSKKHRFFLNKKELKIYSMLMDLILHN